MTTNTNEPTISHQQSFHSFKSMKSINHPSFVTGNDETVAGSVNLLNYEEELQV